MKKYLLFIILLIASSIANAGWIKDQHGCLHNNPHPQPNETVTWNGRCISGYGSGSGTLTWYQNHKLVAKNIGQKLKGKFEGKLKSISKDGKVEYSEQLNGRSVSPKRKEPVDVYALQRKLKKAGYYHGPIDGLVTSDVRKALQNFISKKPIKIEPKSVSECNKTGMSYTDKFWCRKNKKELAIIQSIAQSKKIEEGDVYYVFNDNYGLVQVRIERYAGGERAKADINIITQSLFLGECKYRTLGREWVPAAGLMTCGEAKKYLLKIKGEVSKNWKCVCGSSN